MDAVLRTFTVMMVFHTDCGQDDPVSPGSGRIAFRGVGWSAGGRIPVCIEGFPDRNLVIVPVGCRPAEKNVRAIFSGLHPHGKAWCRGRGFQKRVPGGGGEIAETPPDFPPLLLRRFFPLRHSECLCSIGLAFRYPAVCGMAVHFFTGWFRLNIR